MFGDILHNWDFVGRCYDVLSIDPLNIEAGDKFAMCFDTGDPDQVFDTTNDGSAKNQSVRTIYLQPEANTTQTTPQSSLLMIFSVLRKMKVV